MAILALVAVPAFTGYTAKAKDTKDLQNARIGYTHLISENGKMSSDELKEVLGLPDSDALTINGDIESVTVNSQTYPSVVKSGGENGYSDEEIDNLIVEGYIPIATADELNNIRDDETNLFGKGTKWEKEYTGGLDKKYIQVAKIDLSGYSGGEGWEPIGNYDSRFTGSFDGNGYKIDGLIIDKPSQNYVGLFGYAEGATIRNVGLIDNKVTGKSSIGGLVGKATDKTTISNSYTTGSVTGTGNNIGGLVGNASYSTIANSYFTGSVTGKDKVGGLVGSADGNTTISNSYATGDVTGSGADAGGLVGDANKITISNSYSTSKVTGGGYAGGLVGDAYGNTTISNSYAIGSVEGYSYIGGLVGYAENNTEISNAYATGTVEGYLDVGGLVGYIQSNTPIRNSYWDTVTTKQTRSSGGGTGKTTEEMKKQITYEGWDFSSVWKINEGEYPTLR